MSKLDEATWTASEMQHAVAAAIGKRDFEAAIAWIKLMAIWHPREAQETFDAIQAVLGSMS